MGKIYSSVFGIAIAPINMLSKSENKFWKVDSASIYIWEMIYHYRFLAMPFTFTCNFLFGFPNVLKYKFSLTQEGSIIRKSYLDNTLIFFLWFNDFKIWGKLQSGNDLWIWGDHSEVDVKDLHDSEVLWMANCFVLVGALRWLRSGGDEHQE